MHAFQSAAITPNKEEMSGQGGDNMGQWIKQQLDKLGQSEAPEMLVSTFAQPVLDNFR
jgi:hypothetical protein